MRALLDTNILLDVILDRPEFEAESGALWRACDQGLIAGCISAISLTTIYYVVRRTSGHAGALAAIDQCLAAFEILPVDRPTLTTARGLSGADFEDNVQMACAMVASLEVIVTRDGKGFTGSVVPVLQPRACLDRLAP